MLLQIAWFNYACIIISSNSAIFYLLQWNFMSIVREWQSFDRVEEVDLGKSINKIRFGKKPMPWESGCFTRRQKKLSLLCLTRFHRFSLFFSFHLPRSSHLFLSASFILYLSIFPFPSLSFSSPSLIQKRQTRSVLPRIVKLHASSQNLGFQYFEDLNYLANLRFQSTHSSIYLWYWIELLISSHFLIFQYSNSCIWVLFDVVGKNHLEISPWLVKT